MGRLVMYFDFLKDRIIDCQLGEEPLNWNTATNKFVLSKKTSRQEISEQERRLNLSGFHFPEELKNFWDEIGCGYICTNYFADNGVLDPKTAVDIYLSEGDWPSIKTALNLIEPNELPFLRIKGFDWLTIGLEAGVNLGKIYRYGEEIAPDLTTFIQLLLADPVYYQKQ